MDAAAARDERSRSVRRSRVVLTPRCWCQVPGKLTLLRGDGGKKAVHRGDHEVSRKPLRREGRDASAEPVCSCAFFCACLHTRPRVQRAPGFPCALLLLSRAAIDAKLGRIAPRECGRTSSRCMTIESEIHTHVVPEQAARPPQLVGLLQGFGGSLGQNAALPDASPPPELWVASSSQSCRIPYSRTHRKRRR